MLFWAMTQSWKGLAASSVPAGSELSPASPAAAAVRAGWGLQGNQAARPLFDQLLAHVEGWPEGWSVREHPDAFLEFVREILRMQLGRGHDGAH